MIFTLSNDKLTVKWSSFGGALTSIQNNEGLEYLWQGDKQFWSGQSPVLFPICGSLRDDCAKNLDGEVLTMPRHGLVRKREFICEKQTQSEMIFSLTSDDSLYQHYPYQFKLSIRYQLIDHHILVEYLVSNRSNRQMPFFIGGHPGFNCPLEEGLDFTDYFVEFDQPVKRDLADSLPENGLVDRINRRQLDFDGLKLPMNHQLFKRDALVFDQVDSKKAVLRSEKSKHAITINYEDFSNLLIWSTANEGAFVALEPMSGLSTAMDEDDIFEHKQGVELLDSLSTQIYAYQLSFE